MAEVLAVVAHPDDEVLGCGATLARLASSGHRVRSIMVADGERGRSSASDADVARRQQAACDAAEELGIEAPEFLDLPDQRLETVPLVDITQSIERAVIDRPPDLVVTHDGGDLNLDHRVVHAATMTAFRPLPHTPWQALATFETPSATEYGSMARDKAFQPSVYVDIADTLDAKLRALACYSGEARPAPHPRHTDTVRALALVRGSAVGIEAAEAFRLVFCRGPLALTD